MRIRVIFDRSAFHGQTFDQLFQSRLKWLSKNGVLQVIHTPIFIEETLRFSQAEPTEYMRQVPFIVEICNGGVFLDKDDIWDQELLLGKGSRAEHFLPSINQAELFRVMTSGDLSEAFQATVDERTDHFKKRQNQKKLFGEMRSNFAKNIKATAKPFPADYSYSQFRDAEMPEIGKLMIDRLIEKPKAEQAKLVWLQSPVDFPFVTAFIESMTFTQSISWSP